MFAVGSFSQVLVENVQAECMEGEKTGIDTNTPAVEVKSFLFFGDIVGAHRRVSTLNGSGRNRQKQDAKHAWDGQVGHRRELQGGKTEKFEGGNLRRVNEGRKDHRFLLLMI